MNKIAFPHMGDYYVPANYLLSHIFPKDIIIKAPKITSVGQCAPQQTLETPIITAKIQVNHLIFGASNPNITKPAKDAVVCPDGIELKAQSAVNGKKPVIFKAS